MGRCSPPSFPLLQLLHCACPQPCASHKPKHGGVSDIYQLQHNQVPSSSARCQGASCSHNTPPPFQKAGDSGMEPTTKNATTHCSSAVQCSSASNITRHTCLQVHWPSSCWPGCIAIVELPPVHLMQPYAVSCQIYCTCTNPARCCPVVDHPCC